MTQTRSIQIGLSRDLSEYYVNSIISIEDVTDLAKQFHVKIIELKNAKNKKEQIEEELSRYQNQDRVIREKCDQLEGKT